MDGVPPDLVDPQVPEGIPESSNTSVLVLQRLALEAEDGVEQLLPPSDWTGAAAEAYVARRQRLVGRLVEIDVVASRAAAAIGTWAAQAGPQRTALVRERERLLAIQAQDAAALRAGVAPPAGLQDELAAAVQAWWAASSRFEQANLQLAGAMSALKDEIADRPVDAREQLGDFLHAVWTHGVVEPVQSIWSVTGQFFTDRQSWHDDVDAMVSGWFDLIDRGVHDPIGTARGIGSELVDEPDWRNGHYGEAAGSMAALFIPTPKWLKRGPRAGLERWAANSERRVPISAAWPPFQTAQKLIEGVDLDLHEHPQFGHTLDRHVYVDNAYLMDRLRYGTIEWDGHRGKRVGIASRFTDRAVAQSAITTVLSGRAAELRGFASLPGPGEASLTGRLNHDVGICMTMNKKGFTIKEVRSVTVILKRRADGSVYLYTAYPTE